MNNEIDSTYPIALKRFINLIDKHVNDAKELRGADRNAESFSKTGRKFDRVFVEEDKICRIRYFVDNETGEIYGAKSINAPNMKWYFGNINNSHLWDWSGWHGKPVNDPSVRLVKRYGPFEHYMRVS